MSAQDAAPVVRVVREGFVVRDGTRIVDASSTVTLLDTPKGRFIVDTGSPRDADGLESALGKMGVPLGSVDFIVNTHLHADHCGGNDLFPRARLMAHEFEGPPLGAVKVVGDMPVSHGVMIRITPGHTSGSISVFVEGDRRYVMCGDAIPTRANYESMLPPAVHMDRKLALMSMDRILSWAEIVVPGHDPPFEVSEKSKTEKRYRSGI